MCWPRASVRHGGPVPRGHSEETAVDAGRTDPGTDRTPTEGPVPHIPAPPTSPASAITPTASASRAGRGRPGTPRGPGATRTALPLRRR
ncbi:DNA-directed RNA polymerase III 47 kDa polypeptide [Streptomyces misionensis JCM 4497]